MVETFNFKIVVNNENVTDNIKKYLTSINIIDNEKDEADELTLSLSKFKRPQYKDEIKVFLGYGSKLSFVGLFYVQTTSIKNNKNLTINATGVDFSGDLKEKRDLNYDDILLSKLAKIIADRHNLEIKTNADTSVSTIQQNNESDLNLLNRLAKEYNLIFNIKNATLYFMKKSDVVPQISVDIDKCYSSNISYSNKKFYKSCKAVYHNTQLNKKNEVTYGSGKPVLVVRKQFNNDDEALVFAKNTLIRANKATITGSLTKRGEVVFAGSELALNNDSDKEVYQIKKVSHTIDKGWRTSLTFEGGNKK